MDGIESPGLRAQIANDDASIPALTETLPEAVLALLQQRKSSEIQIVHLTLKVQAESAAIRACAAIRRMIGRAWSRWSNAFPQPGFRAMAGASKPIVTSALKPQRCLLNEAFFGLDFHHDDFFDVGIDTENNPALANSGAQQLLAQLLDGFLQNQPAKVGAMMQFRKLQVRPLGLRRSRLGCPVSSLLVSDAPEYFARRFPVLMQRHDAYAQVMLGADDKHLQFRSVASVQRLENGRVIFRLGTRVRCLNRFGRFYMRAVEHAHRHYVAPAMLSAALEFVVLGQEIETSKAQKSFLRARVNAVEQVECRFD